MKNVEIQAELEQQAALPSLRRSVSRLGLAFFLYMLVCQLGQTLVMVLAGLWWPDLLKSELGVWLCIDLPLYLMAFPVFLLVARGVPNTTAAASFAPQKGVFSLAFFWKLLCAMFAITYVGNAISLGINALLALLKGGAVINPVHMLIGSEGAGSVLVGLFFGCVVPALGEEYVFRGLVYKKLAGFGETPFILFSGFVFALFHANISQLLYAFGLGCVFAWLLCRTGTMFYGMLLHFIINLFGMVVSVQLSKTQVGMYILLGLILVLSALGIFYLMRGFKKREQPAPAKGMPGRPVRAVLLCGGMLSYELLCLALIVFVILV